MVHNIYIRAMLLTLSLIVVSCGNNSSSTGSSDAIAISADTHTDADIKKLELNFHPLQTKYTWKPQYSQSILNYMDRPELSTLIDTRLNIYDLSKLNCFGYNHASVIEKKLFWVAFMASIAHAESTLNPNVVFRDLDGTLSSGLLQIDLQSANRHTYAYTRKTYTQKDLYNPDLNLMAGLYVMKHQLEGGMNDDRPEIAGRLFTQRSYYWSVLTLKRDLIIRTFTKNAMTNLGFCFIGQP